MLFTTLVVSFSFITRTLGHSDTWNLLETLKFLYVELGGRGRNISLPDAGKGAGVPWVFLK
jgi:hypothetical protein